MKHHEINEYELASSVTDAHRKETDDNILGLTELINNDKTLKPITREILYKILDIFGNINLRIYNLEANAIKNLAQNQPQNRFEQCDSVEEVVSMAIGAGSTAYRNGPVPSGEFDTDYALKLSEEATDKILRLTGCADG